MHTQLHPCKYHSVLPKPRSVLQAYRIPGVAWHHPNVTSVTPASGRCSSHAGGSQASHHTCQSVGQLVKVGESQADVQPCASRSAHSNQRGSRTTEGMATVLPLHQRHTTVYKDLPFHTSCVRQEAMEVFVCLSPDPKCCICGIIACDGSDFSSRLSSFLSLLCRVQAALSHESGRRHCERNES